MARLSRAIGQPRLERLAELGLRLTPHVVASAIFSEQGFGILRDQSLRQWILDALPTERLQQVYGSRYSALKTSDLAQFRWGNNQATKEFLALFSIDATTAFEDTSVQPPFMETTDIRLPLFDYQNSIRKQLNLFLNRSDDHRLIAHMPTGSGKTRTTMETIADFMRNRIDTDPTVVIWMAHSDELCEQAIQTFLKIWSKLGSENANVYRMWGGQNRSAIQFNRPVFVVTSFQTCHAAITSSNNDRFEEMAQLRRECDLLVVDEAHMSTAPTYSTAINYLCNQATKLIGLTATPGRHHLGEMEDSTRELADFYRGNKITIENALTAGENPIEFLQGRGILSRVDRRQLDTEVEVELSDQALNAISQLLDIPKNVLTALGENTRRTTLVAATTLKVAVEDQKQTIVFCPTKENATDLALLLQEKNCLARAITGDTPIVQRRTWLEEFRDGKLQVLTNFGVLTTGFDAPAIEAVIIARPTTSVVLYSQMVGRGLRGSSVGGTENCLVIDVVDNITNMPEIPHAFTFFDHHFGGH